MKQKRKGRLLSGCLALWCLGLVILTGLHTNFIVSRASTFRGKIYGPMAQRFSMDETGTGCIGGQTGIR